MSRVLVDATNLRRANLGKSNLRGANLAGIDLTDALLLNVDLSPSVGGAASRLTNARFVLGEGLEKKEDDFAAEVAAVAGT